MQDLPSDGNSAMIIPHLSTSKKLELKKVNEDEDLSPRGIIRTLYDWKWNIF